ncbi:MAG: permease-like cell division protein FtsX [Patescibacteria group bacterium]
MFWTKIKRILRAGFVSFWRNGYVSLASVLVMTVTLSVIASILFTSAMLTSTLNSIKDKVDVNVYFVKTAPEEDIANLKQSLENLPQVAEVEYTSREQALIDFRTRHADDELTLNALEELDENPLGASFNVRAADPSQYESIVTFLQSRTSNEGGTASIIDRINYAQNKQAIDALSRIIDASTKLGSIIVIFFVIVSVLITFNTIRLAIYIFREEISVMRLVGASEMYIRGPFVTVGLMYGFVAGIVTLILLYPFTYWVGPITLRLGTGLNLFDYYLAIFGQLFIVVIGSGLFLGAVSSYLAVKKYLKV